MERKRPISFTKFSECILLALCLRARVCFFGQRRSAESDARTHRTPTPKAFASPALLAKNKLGPVSVRCPAFAELRRRKHSKALRAKLRQGITHYGDSRVDRESPKKRPLNAELTAEAAALDAAWASAWPSAPRLQSA